MPITQVFNYTDFSSTTGLSILGDAAVSGGTKMRMTPSVGGKKGALWYNVNRVSLHAGWVTDFSIQITSKGGGPPTGGDGFTFMLQNDPAGSSFIGPFDGGQLGADYVTGAFVTVFDTWQDLWTSPPNDQDPATPFIAYWSNGPNQIVSITYHHSQRLAIATSPPNFTNGSVHSCRITYDGTNIKTYVDSMTTPVLTYAIGDLGTYLGGIADAWVGFTAATGIAYEIHDILSWSMSAYVSPVGKLGYYKDGAWHLTRDYV